VNGKEQISELLSNLEHLKERNRELDQTNNDVSTLIILRNLFIHHIFKEKEVLIIFMLAVNPSVNDDSYRGRYTTGQGDGVGTLKFSAYW
jgi:hypothetical protein